ncbi:DUF1648 domain-containing protein [Heyndrickxia acidiproducens]|uniref:DUF1648 domain-containing protein n=1 Tax=Heyndrickxia acidiproducens TaxID=1121084 RepID=UPI00037C6CA9|nr:DUF5808 domain-containing protein [Heyndrickxia acidiproducens]
MESAILLIIFGLVAGIMAVTPYITRKTESFGVTIPEQEYTDPALKKLRKQYAAASIILSMLIIAAILILVQTAQMPETGFGLAVIAYIIIEFFVYLYFHKKMKTLKTERNWTSVKKQTIIIDPKFRQQKLTVSNAWFIFHAVIVAGTFAMTYIFYDRIPDRIAMHYTFGGTPTDWKDKSYRTVFEIPAVQLVVLALFIWINTMIEKSKQQLNAANPEKSLEQNIRFRRRWSSFTVIAGFILIFIFFAVQLSFIIPLPVTFLLYGSIGAVLLIVAGAMFLSVTTGQGGSRIRTGSGPAQNGIHYDDDQYWKLGVFYYNKNDPSIWIEKRFGSGWTMNFAHPLGWTILILILVIPILLTIFFSK